MRLDLDEAAPGPSGDGAPEVTDDMVSAAEAAMLDYARQFNIVSLDEIHRETIRIMLVAALSRVRRV
jgi:hypothetical protein